VYDAIVVLGGGTGDAAVLRISVGCKFIRDGKAKYLVIVGSKDEVEFMLTKIKELGCWGKQIYYDVNSRNTIDNAYYAKKILKIIEARRIGLVTSEFHMERALTIFEWALGDDYIVEPIPVHDNPSKEVLEREELLKTLIIPLIKEFRKGDDEELKKLSDILEEIRRHLEASI